MPGLLDDAPSAILRQALVDMGHGVEPTTQSPPQWSSFADIYPPLPDDCIIVVNVTGIDHGLDAHGERGEMNGIQIIVRSVTPARGWTKAMNIAVGLDRLFMRQVVVTGENGTNTYRVWMFKRTGQPIPLGREQGKGTVLTTLNGMVSVRQLN